MEEGKILNKKPTKQNQIMEENLLNNIEENDLDNMTEKEIKHLELNTLFEMFLNHLSFWEDNDAYEELLYLTDILKHVELNNIDKDLLDKHNILMDKANKWKAAKENANIHVEGMSEDDEKELRERSNGNLRLTLNTAIVTSLLTMANNGDYVHLIEELQTLSNTFPEFVFWFVEAAKQGEIGNEIINNAIALGGLAMDINGGKVINGNSIMIKKIPTKPQNRTKKKKKKNKRK